MKMGKISLIICLLLACSLLPSCRRNTDDVWEDTKSASRHMNRGFRTLGGKHGDSRAVQNRQDFEYYDQPVAAYGMNDEFIPMADGQNSDEIAMVESYAPQPRESPGDPGSSIPGSDQFRDPSTIPGLAGIFKNIHFEYNSNLIKGQENFEILNNIADYMRKHPDTYIFVEGHTDERGPEAYNLALGSRRSNAARNELIAAGISPDNIFTISYGKERPLVMDHHEEAWSKNRRAEFKIYQR